MLKLSFTPKSWSLYFTTIHEKLQAVMFQINLKLQTNSLKLFTRQVIFIYKTSFIFFLRTYKLLVKHELKHSLFYTFSINRNA